MSFESGNSKFLFILLLFLSMISILGLYGIIKIYMLGDLNILLVLLVPLELLTLSTIFFLLYSWHNKIKSMFFVNDAFNLAMYSGKKIIITQKCIKGYTKCYIPFGVYQGRITIHLSEGEEYHLYEAHVTNFEEIEKLLVNKRIAFLGEDKICK